LDVFSLVENGTLVGMKALAARGSIMIEAQK
jgi:hypothetical protein